MIYTPLTQICQAKQKLSEYHSSVANEAIIVVTAYMLSKRFNTSKDRAEYITWALSEKDNWPFRFERVVETDNGTMVSSMLIYLNPAPHRTRW